MPPARNLSRRERKEANAANPVPTSKITSIEPGSCPLFDVKSEAVGLEMVYKMRS